ncbi:hypothetical protein L3Q82_009493, partial [Scortum barcoo]
PLMDSHSAEHRPGPFAKPMEASTLSRHFLYLVTHNTVPVHLGISAPKGCLYSLSTPKPQANNCSLVAGITQPSLSPVGTGFFFVDKKSVLCTRTPLCFSICYLFLIDLPSSDGKSVILMSFFPKLLISSAAHVTHSHGDSRTVAAIWFFPAWSPQRHRLLPGTSIHLSFLERVLMFLRCNHQPSLCVPPIVPRANRAYEP